MLTKEQLIRAAKFWIPMVSAQYFPDLEIQIGIYTSPLSISSQNSQNTVRIGFSDGPESIQRQTDDSRGKILDSDIWAPLLARLGDPRIEGGDWIVLQSLLDCITGFAKYGKVLD